jgi:acetate kinase
MGFTPLEGLMMGTRSGNLDLGAMMFLMRKESNPNETVSELLKRTDDMLNKKSGMMGICGFSDMRDAQNGAENGDANCVMALEMYAYRVKKFIGSYAAAMGGVDILVFSGGIGENNAPVRHNVCTGLDFMGIEFDEKINASTRGEIKLISKHESKVKVIIVPTNEELVIARDTMKLVSIK